MLDTNAVSAIIRGKSAPIQQRVAEVGTDDLCMSVMTEAEILFGLARKPEAVKIAKVAKAFLSMIPILKWTSREAFTHAQMCAKLEKSGTPLAIFDSFIAAQALAANCTLVSADKAFRMVPNLKTVNWEA